MGNTRKTASSPAAFFALTLLLSAPLYLLNALAFREVLGTPGLGAVYIALLTFTPALAAALLTWRAQGSGAVKRLLLRVFDVRRVGRAWWYLLAVFLGPSIFALSIGWMVYADVPVPAAMVPLVALPVVFAFVFLLAAGEETGWMGYAFEPMQARYGALHAALGLSVIWAIWHVPFFVFLFPDPIMFAAELLTLVAARILLVWLFLNAGRSVFVVTLCHAADNTALMIFPNIKDTIPLGSVVHSGVTLALAVAVVLLWDSRSMTRLRVGSRSAGRE